MEIYETILPGLGTKSSFMSSTGEISVISKLDGTSEIYFVHNENFFFVALSDEEAKTLALLLLECKFEKKEGNRELNLGKSKIRWVKIEKDGDSAAIEMFRNAILILREGKIERNLNLKPKSGDYILVED